MIDRFRYVNTERERDRKKERERERERGQIRAWRAEGPQMRLRKRPRFCHALVQKLLAVGEQCLQAVQFRV